MQDENLYRRIEDEYDPERCRCIVRGKFQCYLKAVPGTHYCIAHNGAAARDRNYKSERHRKQLTRFRDSDSLKSLYDEIAIVRTMVQNILKIADEHDIIMFSSQLQTLASQVNSLTLSCALLEKKLEGYMARENAYEIVSRMIAATKAVIPDTEESKLIREELTEILEQMYMAAGTPKLGNYSPQHWASELAEWATNKKIVTVREEIGILRLLVEEKLNRCHNGHELLRMTLPICQVIAKIEKLVVSCHKLEQLTNLLMDEQQATAFIDRVIECVGNNIKDTDTLTSIVAKFSEVPSAPVSM